MRRLHAALLIATVMLAAADALPSSAQPQRACRIVGDELDCRVGVEDPGTPARPGHQSAQPAAAEPTATWTAQLLTGEYATVVAAPCETDDGEIGYLYVFTLTDNATGEVLDRDTRCVAETDAPEPDAAAPPAPPTIEELIDITPIPEPVIMANPSGRGLTGLESRFWVDNPTTVTASATLRGWSVTGTLHAQRWAWVTGDGGRYTAQGPGTPEDPAIAHTYQAKDTWEVSVTVNWAGSYEVAGWGTVFTVDDLTTTGASSVDYTVIEVRGVLDEEAP